MQLSFSYEESSFSFDTTCPVGHGYFLSHPLNKVSNVFVMVNMNQFSVIKIICWPVDHPLILFSEGLGITLLCQYSIAGVIVIFVLKIAGTGKI